MNRPLFISNFKKVLKGVLFLLILFGINRVLVYLYGQMTASSILARRDTRFHDTDKTGVDILVLGDSHAYCAISREPFERKLLKWVSPAESYPLNYYKLKYSLTRFKPKIVILPLDLHSFSFSSFRVGIDRYWVKYADYCELGAISGKRLLYARKYIEGEFFPYIGAGATLNEWAVKELFKLKKKGMMLRQELNVEGKEKAGSRERHPRLTKSFARIRANAHLGNKRYFYKPMVIYFKKILTLCRENNITVLLVKYPVSKDYYEYASTLMPIRRFNRGIKKILKDYDNYYILDFREIFFSRIEFMRDVDHVNEKGGGRISHRIAQFIKEHKLEE